MTHGRIIDKTYLLTNELISFSYNPNKRELTPELPLTQFDYVLAFSTITHDLMPTNCSLLIQIIPGSFLFSVILVSDECSLDQYLLLHSKLIIT